MRLDELSFEIRVKRRKIGVRNNHVLFTPAMMLKVMIYDNDDNESRRSLFQLALQTRTLTTKALTMRSPKH